MWFSKASLCSDCKLLNSGGSRMRLLIFLVILAIYFAQVYSQIDSTERENMDIVPLIHNGVQSSPSKWPWHATLFIRSALCGGTFIDNNTVLTAAHCFVTSNRVSRENDVEVFGGRKYRDATTPGMQELKVARIIVHHEYNNSNFANDIAILKLSTDIKITNIVQNVSVWNTETNQNESKGTVIGFGLDEDDEESDTLQEAEIPVFDREACLERDKETYEQYLTDKMFCAGGDGVSACNGDSGGGMFFNINDTWHLRGVVSFSPVRPNVEPPVCDSSKPTVFTDVSKYRSWILRHTNTRKWLNELHPCKNDTIDSETECNVARHLDNSFLIVAEHKNIFRVPTNGDPVEQVFPEFGKEIDIEGLDYDCAEDRLYWVDCSALCEIFSTKYDGTDMKSLQAINYCGTPMHIAVDWISRRLYWVSDRKETIEVSMLDNPDKTATVWTNVHLSDQIAVDPLRNKLYRLHKNRWIESSNLDGSERESLLDSGSSSINEMKVSIATGELCYIVQTTNIDCIDTRTKRIRMIVHNLTNPRTLVVSDDIVYWTEANNLTIKGVNHQGVRQKSIQYHGTYDIGSLFAPRMCPKFYSPCSIDNGDCPENTVCLLNPRIPSGKICKRIDPGIHSETDLSEIIKFEPTPNNRNGTERKETKWPWYASLHSGLRSSITYFCGGSILNRNTVVTAAHCFYKNTTEGLHFMGEGEIVVLGGSKYVDGLTDNSQVSKVENIMIHPEYSHPNSANDIAILKLSLDFNITKFVQPVAFWSMNSDQSQNSGTYGTVVGFGSNEDGKPFNTLQEANFTVLDTKKCLESGPTISGSFSTSHTYCAGESNNIRACNGVNGGGMFFNFNGTWYLQGIVSFNPTRSDSNDSVCDTSKPTAFTDVSKYRSWITRYANITQWLKELKPCKDGMIGEDTECNAVSQFDYRFLSVEEGEKTIRVPTKRDTAVVVRTNESVWDGLDYDCVEGRFYRTTHQKNIVFSEKYDGTDKKTFITQVLHTSNIAVDWISRRLYWYSQEKETIEVCLLDNPDVSTTVWANAHDFNQMAVDPLQSKLYRLRRKVKIEWSNLDGSEPELLEDTFIIRISAIAVSMATGELCYSYGIYSIECMDPRTKQTRTIVKGLTNLRAFAVSDEMFYWIEKSSGTLESMNHQGVHQKPVQYNQTGDIKTLHVISAMCPMFYSPCTNNNGGCPENTICLVSPHGQSGKICKSAQKIV